MRIFEGLVDIDSETGNLQESLEEKEVIWLREFLEHVPSITYVCACGVYVCVCLRVWVQGLQEKKRCGETNPRVCGRCAKGLVVVEAGNLNKCIYGVISGSLSVQDKDGECLISGANPMKFKFVFADLIKALGVVFRRVSPGGFLGHWSYFSTGEAQFVSILGSTSEVLILNQQSRDAGNRGASFSVMADDEGTVIFEFSRHLMDKCVLFLMSFDNQESYCHPAPFESSPSY